MQNLHQETLATHAGYNSQKEQNGAVAVPLYLSNAFDFGTSQTAAARFALQELGPFILALQILLSMYLKQELERLKTQRVQLVLALAQRLFFMP